MKIRKFLCVGLTAGAALLAGCDNSSSNTGSTGSTGTAQQNLADKADEAMKKAQDLIAQVNTAIKDNKLDDAQASLDKLTTMQDQLSEDLKKQVDGLKTTVENLKKGAAGLSMPKLP